MFIDNDNSSAFIGNSSFPMDSNSNSLMELSPKLESSQLCYPELSEIRPFNESNDLQNKIDKAILLASDSLSNAGEKWDDNFDKFTFGSNYNKQLSQEIKDSLKNNPSSLFNTKIVILDSKGLFNGAYSSQTDKIYLDQSFLENNSIDSISFVISEELGHRIDHLINETDSSGDEGELFANLIFHKFWTEDQLQAMKTENDNDTLIIDGYEIKIEKNVGITLHEHAAFQGKPKTFTVGKHSYVGDDFNDIATSITIPSNSNLVAIVYSEANFQGGKTVISRSQASIGADWNDANNKVSHLNDAVSSIEVRYLRDDEVILYQHGNFQGLALSQTIGNYSMVVHNDNYSSLDLPAGVVVEASEHSNYGGEKVVYTSDVANMGSFNDKMSSFKAYQTNLIATTANLDNLINNFDSQYKGKSFEVDGAYYAQCVDFTKMITNNYATTPNWKKGSNVMTSDLGIGTAIATFNSSAKYSGHTCIFAGFDTVNGVKGFWIWNQNYSQTNKVTKDFIRNNGSGVNDADNYFIIKK